MKIILAVSALLGGLIAIQAQSTNVIPLWPERAPGALGNTTNDIPTLTLFFAAPEKATGASFVICPGGAYGGLAAHEGRDYARWLNGQGIAGFELQYRLGRDGYRHPVMLNDAARAVRLVRARAAGWNLDPGRIGIMGSSAGGHLASTLLTHFDAGNSNAVDVIERQSSRPDLGILCYPVITMGRLGHRGSRANLLGTNAAPELVEALSNELHVTPATPQCFIWHTDEDTSVPVENSMEFAAALRKAGVPFDLHIYQRGRHGIGLGSRESYDPALWHPWTGDCAFWLREREWAR